MLEDEPEGELCLPCTVFIDGNRFGALFSALKDAEVSLRELSADLNEAIRGALAAALSAHSIGADRNRGFGWVDIRRVGPEPDDAFVARVAELMGMRS